MAAAASTYRVPAFWKVQAAGWFVYWIVLFITFMPMVPSEGQMIMLLKVKFVRSVIGLTLTGLLHPLYRSLAGRASHKTVIAVVMTASVIMGAVWVGLADLYKYWATGSFTLAPDLLAFPRSTIDYSMTIAAWSCAYFGFKHWQQWQAAREGMLRSESLANEARLEALRYQLQPHFLFNALNSVRALSGEDPMRAGRMVTELSEFLRYSLVMANRTTVALAEEIAAMRSYLAVENVRFEEKLAVKFEIAPEAEPLHVPVLLLHPLVENAIKHGFTNSAQPLCMRIGASLSDETLVIEVANTGSWNSENGHSGTGTGLKNVRERLQQAFGTRASFHVAEKNGWITARLELPRDLSEGAEHERHLARIAH